MKKIIKKFSYLAFPTLLVIPTPFFIIHNQKQIYLNHDEFKEIKNIKSNNLITATTTATAISKNEINKWFEADNNDSDNSQQSTKKENEYIFNINIKKYLDKYFIGDWSNVKNNRYDKYFEDTYIKFENIDNELYQWKGDWGGFERTSSFLWEWNKVNNNWMHNFKANNSTRLTNWDMRVIYWGVISYSDKNKNPWNYECDFESFDNYQYIYFNYQTGEISLKLKNKLEAFDKNNSGWTRAKSKIKLLKNAFNLNYNLTLPYTQYDVNLFKEKFKDLISQPIVLNNVKDPIIFDYSEGSENENKVLEIIKNRVKNFFNDKDIINSKLGPISIYDPNSNTYVENKETGFIKSIVEDSQRGNKQTATIKVRYQLPPEKTFEFFNGNKNYYEETITITTKLAIEEDYKIDSLVKITPYKGSSNGYQDNFKTKNYLNCRIGQNIPEPNIISTKKININEAKYIENNGNENLIPIEKFPVISKAGTIANISLKIKLGSIEFEETIAFNRVFTNGKIFSIHTIQNDLYLNSTGIKIKNNQLKLGLELTETKVNLFFVEDPQLILKNQELETNSCFIEVSSINISIPSEQVNSSSKWIQIQTGKFIKDKNNENNIIRYTGKYEVFDPFFFEMTNKMIDVYDPITLKPLGTFSQYKPYIVDGEFDIENQTINGNTYPIYPSASSNKEDSIFKANLGPYIMAKKLKDQSSLEFCIVIKEFDRKSNETNIEDRYTKTKWILNVSMNLLNAKSVLKMIGYDNNENINQINDQKYFNEEDVENYRGNFANRETGMYIPKIVWVNAYPPEAFLYDPRDKNGQLIVPIDDDGTIASNAKYDIGYIAELNGTAFASGDYTSNETFGGFEILFDENKFTPTGLIPYIEKYQFNQNSLEPLIEKISLSTSGFQYVDSSSDFAQIVLKRPNSNTYLYQFFRINSRNEILKYNQDLISIYGNKIGLKGQPLFIDFWDTYHGDNLKKYLLDKKLIEDEGKVKELEYHDVIQYWNIYVNDPDNYNGTSLEGNNIAKFDPNLGYGIIGPLDEGNNLKDFVIEMITKKLNEILYKEGWINEDLQYMLDFRIEENSDIFENKINQLMNQYDKNLLDAQIIDFSVIINDEAFINKPIKITGKNSLSILYNKDANNIIDLSRYKGISLLINSSSNYYEQNNRFKKIEQIEVLIKESINKDLTRVMKKYGAKLGLENYLPKENVDYKLKFHDKNGNYYKDIQEAIRSCLISNDDSDYFNNNLFIEIEAIFNNQSHFMKNSFTKIVNNNINNNAIQEIENFNLSTIEASDLKINTTKDGYLNDNKYWLSNDDNDTKARGIWNLLLNRVQNDINLYSRKWINAYNKTLVYGINYEIKLIKKIEENNTIYYEAKNEKDFIEIIKNILLNNLENEINSFNRNLVIDVVSINSSNHNSYTIGSFRKAINNSYLNDGIEDDSNPLNNKINDENSLVNLDNNLSSNKSINMWWIITPLTIFGLGLISLIIVIIIRKNRRIR